MSSPTPATLSDVLIEPFVRAPSDDEARRILTELIGQHAAPVVRRTVRGQTLRLTGAIDVEDVEHTVLLRLADHLWRVRRGSELPIGSLSAYAARAAANACHEWLRAARPQRARLQSRLRYAFRHHARLALWERAGGGWVCGLAEWRDVGRILEWPAVAAWRGRLATPPAQGGPDGEARRLVRLAETIVDALGAPARFEDVVTLAADALGVEDRPPEPMPASASDSSDALVIPAAATPLDTALDRQRFLARVWREIAELPLRQRTALLLNLTGPGGQDLLSLIPASGIATWESVGAVLEMDPATLQRVAAGLPHDDHTIAGLLGVARRQVINLRKCARERLARRLGLDRPARRGAAS